MAEPELEPGFSDSISNVNSIRHFLMNNKISDVVKLLKIFVTSKWPSEMIQLIWFILFLNRSELDWLLNDII